MRAQPLIIRAHALTSGTAVGPKAVLTEPLSFWGGYDAVRGVIVESTHPGYGRSLAATILVMPHAKGSSSSSSVLVEALRNGTGPAGIVLRERDLIIAIGVVVANELYRLAVPLVALKEQDFKTVCNVGMTVRIEAPRENAAARLILMP